MRLEISFNDLPFLKADLRQQHPDVLATRRIEGAARGLGFKSYAAMRLALVRSKTVVPDDSIFVHYIGYLPEDGEVSRSLSRAVARIAVRRALAKEPRLTARGFDSARPESAEERRMTWTEREVAFAKRRQEALGDSEMDEFELALVYFDMQERRKTINYDFGSYGLKHRAENLSRDQGLHTHLGNYVSNGMLIAAAITRGFDMRPTHPGSPNACFNVSSKTIRATASGPITTRRQQADTVAWAMRSVLLSGGLA